MENMSYTTLYNPILLETDFYWKVVSTLIIFQSTWNKSEFVGIQNDKLTDILDLHHGHIDRIQCRQIDGHWYL